jgi:hypothetical protein
VQLASAAAGIVRAVKRRMNLLHSRTAIVLVLTALLAGCTTDSGARTDSVSADSMPGAGSPTDAPGVNVDANPTSTSSRGSTRADSAKSVSFNGIGQLRVGMTAAQARAALGVPASSSASPNECRYLDTKGRSRVYVMLVRDTVARLDVRDSTLATQAGARIGDPESRVLELYRGRVTTEPHKYVQGGHYLIVASPASSTRQLVFETDGKRVTSYRVGRLPEVRWVEGCS